MRNTGPVVDQVSFDVVGPAAEWSVIEPPVLNLYPGDTGQVRIHFRPPRRSEPGAGPQPFGFKAIPLEDPRGSVVEEGTVVVAPFTELRVTLRPQISRGARRGAHKLDIANLGNVPIGTEISVIDQDDALTFDVQQAAAVAGPGLVHRTKVVATPRETFWSGAQRSQPFEIVVQPDRGEAVTTTGTFEQDPIVPRWALVTAVAVMALALVMAGLWAAVFKPAVESAATEAAKKETAKVAEDMKQAAVKAATGGGAEGGGTKASPSPSTSASPSPADPNNKPLDVSIDFRIAAPATVGGSVPKVFDAPPGQSNKPLAITDVQLQNPALDTGLLEIRRNGKVVTVYGLENYTLHTEHFVEPWKFAKGDKLTVAVICNNPAPEKKKCSPGVWFGGRTTS